jgi:multidrug efflux pump subunit AcrB
MTAAAMLVGMLPMAIGVPGEEQNAVLARAVIGGVLVGTLTTLFFVPYLYSIIGRYETRRTPPGEAEPAAAAIEGQTT